MVKTISTLTIRKPIGEVWNYFTDSDNLRQWAKGFQSSTLISGQLGSVGAVSRQLFIAGGRKIELTEEIVCRQKPTLIAYQLENRLMSVRIENRLYKLSAETTEFVSVFQTRFKPFWLRMFEPFLKRSLQKSQDTDLFKLKEILESSVNL